VVQRVVIGLGIVAVRAEQENSRATSPRGCLHRCALRFPLLRFRSGCTAGRVKNGRGRDQEGPRAHRKQHWPPRDRRTREELRCIPSLLLAQPLSKSLPPPTIAATPASSTPLLLNNDRPLSTVHACCASGILLLLLLALRPLPHHPLQNLLNQFSRLIASNPLLTYNHSCSPNCLQLVFDNLQKTIYPSNSKSYPRRVRTVPTYKSTRSIPIGWILSIQLLRQRASCVLRRSNSLLAFDIASAIVFTHHYEFDSSISPNPYHLVGHHHDLLTFIPPSFSSSFSASAFPLKSLLQTSPSAF
jgi:hypothetical protein